jgi:hypothetical protein
MVKAAKNRNAFIYPMMNVHVNLSYVPRALITGFVLKYVV